METVEKLYSPRMPCCVEPLFGSLTDVPAVRHQRRLGAEHLEKVRQAAGALPAAVARTKESFARPRNYFSAGARGRAAPATAAAAAADDDDWGGAAADAADADGAHPTAREIRNARRTANWAAVRPANKAAFVETRELTERLSACLLAAVKQQYEEAVLQALDEHCCRLDGVVDTAVPPDAEWSLVTVVTAYGSFEIKWPVSVRCPAPNCAQNGHPLRPITVNLFECNPTFKSGGHESPSVNVLFEASILNCTAALTQGTATISYLSA